MSRQWVQDLLDAKPVTEIRRDTRRKLEVYLAVRPRAVTEPPTTYGATPDRLSVALEALAAIRDAAVAALRQVDSTAGDEGLPGQGGVEEGPPRRVG